MKLQANNLTIRAQIVSAIQEDIFSNRKVGDKLPSEADYADYFGVTRSTVQKALKDLQRMNLIQKVQGKGSFVHQTQPKVRLFNFKGFTDYAKQIGANPVSKVIKQKKVTHDGNKVLSLKRLRLFETNGKLTPITLDESEINLRDFPKIDKNDFEKKSLYQVIRDDYHVIPSTTILHMSAVKADDATANLFGCNVGDPLLRATGVVHDESGKVIEQVKVTYSDFTEFDLTLGI
ncbi:GntR family transcriptional regulator [Lactobacillus sp. 3B(2020)]|uniref:GntR family transcriptional regulator n=1 Tax=Lactobacillus sp. 3B(2020) TaxID=2695882 RepID=UPI0015DEEE44|nr:GntR family transcriptional regulator [Lactobacillus sp. 3B(2020)]QLL69137.1 UTRA domain-containing protein [Lactobacillus sp. 3B(2020)]